MSKYKCLRPRVIRNSNGNLVNVSCGRCEACLTMRASRDGKLITLESEDWKYTEYFTLSYAPAYLPVCSIRTLGSHVFLMNETPRLSGFYENDVVGFSDNSHLFCDSSMLSALFDKIYDESHREPYQYGEGFIPYVSKVDFQLFMKRFRRYIDYHNYLKDTDEKKIKYYCAAEYGPDHFRPHFHVLVFHDSDNLRRRIRHVLHKTWTFGNIDNSLSAGHTASYVASYCSSVADMPEIYETKGLRPFSLHSSFLGQGKLQQLTEKIVGEGDTGYPRTYVKYGDSIREVFAPISLQTKLLPKCFRHVLTDDYGAYVMLSVCSRICQLYSIEEPTATNISAVVKYVDSSERKRIEALFDSPLEDSSIDTICRISLNYYRLCKKYPCVDIRARISKFFKTYDYDRLCRQYESQIKYINEFGLKNSYFLGLFYDNCPVPFRDSSGRPVYREPYNASDYRLSARFYASLGFDIGTLSCSDYSYFCDPDYFKQSSFVKNIFKEKSKMKYYNDKFGKYFNN